jgi:competence protein ComEC
MKTLLAILLTLASTAAAQAPLKIFFIDVEGGQSTLFVAPSGQSLLVDTGWPGNDNRDANRIVAAAHKAGLTRIDTVLLTHYHVDHAGGIPQLLAQIPVGTFLDHGPNRELDHGITEKDYAEYQKVLATGKYKHLVPHPGDHLPLPGFNAPLLNITVLSADGVLIDHPLPNAGQPNPFCATSELRPADDTENARSLGIELTFGKLRILDLGDLTWDKERTLVCPNNNIGPIDILVVSHHGWDHSSSPALIDAIHPRVAIMDNGETKGGSTSVLKTIKAAPGLETLWQLHYSNEGGPNNNTDPKYIANPQGPDAGNFLELDASPNGTFTITNSRTSASQSYPATR